MMQKLRKKNYSPRVEEDNTLPGSPLLSSHTKWRVGRSFVFHSPNSSLGSCQEWMSLRCWTPGSATDAVLATWPVLVARHSCADAESDQQLREMHPAWRQSYQSPNVTNHCYHTFRDATCWLYQHVGHDEVGSTPNVVSLLVFCDHFMKHLIAYVTPNETVKTVAKFLWQGYISIFTMPSSRVTKGPTLKATPSESFGSLWAYRRLGLHFYHTQTNGQVEWA